MKKFLIFLFIFSCIGFGYADQIDLLSSYWDFYSVNYNNFISMGLGFSNLSDIGGAEYALQNPAAVDITENNTFFSVGYKNKIALADTLIMNGRNPIIFFDYSASYKDITNYSIGFEQTKSFQITNNNETYLKDKKLFYRDNTYYLSANLKKIKFIRLGLGLLLKSIYLDEETGSAYIDRFKKTIVTYKMAVLLIPIKNLNIAATFIPSTDYKISVLNSDDETFSTNNKTLPSKANFGLSYKLKNFGIYYQLSLEKTSDDFYLTKDKLNHHFGISFEPKKNIKLLSGFFTNNSSYNLQSQAIAPDLPKIHSEFFISGGLILQSDDFSVGFSVADSHFSNAYTPKTYISAGFSYKFITLF